MHKEWQGHSGEILGSKNNFDVIECVNCGFNHVVPIPTEEFLSEYYKKDFVNNRQIGFYKKVEKDVPWWEIFYNEKYDLFEKHVNKEDRSILDIGSGLGYFLKRGKERGWVTFGIEPSDDSCDYSKKHGLKIANEYLNENNYQDLGKFDVVHMHEVLEHLPNPIKLIKLVKKMLNPDGLVCIVSPNDYNPLQEAFVKNSETPKWWIAPPEHINYFDFSTINNILKSNGFTVVEQTSTFPLELFLLMGDNYVAESNIGKLIHSKRVTLETTLYDKGYENIRRAMYRKFAEIGLGREFVIIGRVI